jgi:hypothetical protein
MNPLKEAVKRLKQAAIGAIRTREKDRIAARHKKKFAAFFRKQRDLVLAEMEKNQFLFSESYRQLAEASPVDFTVQNWDRIWDIIAHNSTDELQRLIINAEADGMQAGATRTGKILSMTGPLPTNTFNLANPRSVAWFQQNGGSVDLIKGIQTTTGDQIKTIIGKAIDSGQSYTKTAKEIRESFDGMTRQRSITIATNEVGNAYEQGNMEFAQSLRDNGVVMVKRWNTSGDELVSEVCQRNEDEGLIPINQYHQSGHQQPLAHPNCRCWESYEQATE